MANVFTEIVDWVQTLPYWEQAAFDKVYKGVDCTESDYSELLRYLLEDVDLETKTSKRPVLGFVESAAALEVSPKKIQLKQIYNLQNVNALVAGQKLTFGPNLTVIFGANGSGKSGYARVLGCAGFTRGDKKVLPDITKELSETPTLSAQIDVFDGTTTSTISYQVRTTCPELARFYVFDSTSVRRHLSESNTFSFSPASLFYLTRFAELTDKIRDSLKERISECEIAHLFSNMFFGESDISKLVAELGANTDINALEKLAVLLPEDIMQIEQLSKNIARLRSKDIDKEIHKANQNLKDLDDLVKHLEKTQRIISKDNIEKIISIIQEIIVKEYAAKSIGIEQFKTDKLTKVGSGIWHKFIEAAREFADAEGTSEKSYPKQGDYCLLCQQPLTPEALVLITKFWGFLKGEAQTDLLETHNKLTTELQPLETLDLDFLTEVTANYRYLKDTAPELLEQVIAFIAVTRQQRDTLIRMIINKKEETLPNNVSSCIAAIKKRSENVITERKKLEEQNPGETITKLEADLLTLKHREILQKHIAQIKEYVQKRVWASRALTIRSDTRHITLKHNELFKKLVADRYVEIFRNILKELQRPIQIKIATSGAKATAIRQIVLETTSTIEDVTPEQVLSEGEKRAAALADFLAEITLDTYSDGIVLDDPVTSLDLEWREIVAKILAKEAGHRQTIVFTHDLPFVYYLRKYTEEQGINIVTHWIKRGEDDNKPGYVWVDNCPGLERDFRTASQAREVYKRAKDAPPEEQEKLLREGFGALRGAYEAFIIFDLFNQVVLRWDEQIKFGRLKDIKWDQSIADEVVAKCEELSRYITGHLHSDAFASVKPTPEQFLKEIQDFDAIKKRLKELV